MNYPEALISKEKVVDNIGIFKDLPDGLTHKTEECGYVPPVPSTDPKQQHLEAQIQRYLGNQIRVEIIDGRVYTGTFYCYDCQGNIILTGSRKVGADGSLTPSGMAMVPVNTVVSVKAKQ